MNSQKLVAILVVAVLAVAGISAYAITNNNSGENSNDITLVLGTIEETGPISTTSSSFYEQRRMMVQEPLLSYDAGGKFVNMTVETVETSDNITYSIKLLNNILWSDGEKYSANDVKYTVDIYNVARPSVTENIKSVNIIDELNFTMVLNNAGDLGGVVSNMPILPEHIWKDLKWSNVDDYQKITDARAFIGTGPYKVDNLNSAGDELTYVFNDNFRDEAPNVKKIIFKHYGNENALALALLAGDVDAVYNYGTPGISSTYLDKIKESESLDYMSVSTGGVPASVMFNMRSPVSSDQDFRNAFKYAINYAEIIDRIAPATGISANGGLVPSTISGYIDTEALAMDKNKAENCMKAYFSNHGLNWSSDKVDAKVLVWSRTQAEMFSNIFNLLKEYMESINVNLVAKTVLPTEFAATAKDPETAMTLWFMTDGAIKNYAGFATHYISATGTLKFVYGNPAIDETYEKIVTDMGSATTEEAKKQCAERFQQFYSEKAVALPLYWGGYIQPYSTEYTGWVCGMASGLLCYENLFGLSKA